MKCSDIIGILNRFAPEHYAENWDNTGLQIGRRDKSISRLLIVLDITDEVVEYAVSNKIDLILSHHPLIFSAMKKITSDDFMGRRLLQLIGSDICVYSMHTNFDSVPGGMGSICAEKLGIIDPEPLDDIYTAYGPNGEEISAGIGMIGMLEKPLEPAVFCAQIKRAFGLEHVSVFSGEELPVINCVAVCPGSGKSVIATAIRKGAEVLVTGDIGHHAGIDAVAEGMMVIDAGHYGLEHVFIDFMEQFLSQKISAEVELVTMPPKNPIMIV